MLELLFATNNFMAITDIYQGGEGVHGVAGALRLLLHRGAVVLLRGEDLGPDDTHGGSLDWLCHDINLEEFE